MNMKKKWWIPALLVVLFGIESVFSLFFPAHYFSADFVFVPRLILIYLIFLAIFYNFKTAILFSFIMGLMMDIVYLEIMGIYFFFYPSIVFLVSKLMKLIHSHLFIMAFVVMLAITVLEFGLYGFYYLIQIADFSIERFANDRLFPTLLLNLSFYIIASYPLKKNLLKVKKFKEEEEGMFQS